MVSASLWLEAVGTMMVLIVGVAAFALGVGIGGASIMRQVKSGRLVAGGRIYRCEDTGPVVR